MSERYQNLFSVNQRDNNGMHQRPCFVNSIVVDWSNRFKVYTYVCSKCYHLHWKHPSFEICRVIINLPQSHQKCIKDKQIVFFWFVISMLFEAQFIKDIDKIDRHTNRFGFSDDFFKNWTRESTVKIPRQICKYVTVLPRWDCRTCIYKVVGSNPQANRWFHSRTKYCRLITESQFIKLCNWFVRFHNLFFLACQCFVWERLAVAILALISPVCVWVCRVPLMGRSSKQQSKMFLSFNTIFLWL